MEDQEPTIRIALWTFAVLFVVIFSLSAVSITADMTPIATNASEPIGKSN